MVDSTAMQSGRYQAYPEYKDSGVEWLGEIPSGWDVLKLKRVIREHSGNGFPIELQNDKSGTVPFLKVSDISGIEKFVGTPANFVSSENIKRNRWNIVPKGSIVTGKIGEALRKNHRKILLVDSVIDNNCIGIEPITIFSDFNYYAHKLIDFDWYVNPGAVPSISVQKYKEEHLAVPSTNEQEKIVSFLNYETAKIDSLIEKQQRLIELLTEKRQAVISHAVTKGLNPEVPMKDSGVEWLGEVPAHWEVTRIKHVVNTFEQGWSPQCDSRPADKDEYGVLKVGSVNYGEFRSDENKALPPELTPRKQYQIKKDDLLISRANTKELVGSAAVVGKDYPQLLLCDKLYRLKLNANALPSLIALYLSIAPVRGQVELQASGASHSMQNISQDVIKELPCLIPPLEEAQKLVEKINAKLEVFNQITSKAQQQIQLMQERRTALISAAVTGKIDVRDWDNN